MADLYEVKMVDGVSAPAKKADRAAKSLGDRILSIGRFGDRSARGVSSLGSAASRVGGLFASMGGRIRGAAGAVGRFNVRIKETVATSLSSALSGSLGPFGGLIGGATKALGPIAAAAGAVAGFVAGARKIVGLGKQLDEFRNALTNITGSGKSAEEALLGIRKQAEFIGTDVVALGNRVIDTMRRGFNLRDALQLSGLREDLKAATGATEQVLSGAFEQLEKGLQRGKFEAEAFDVLRKVGIDVNGIFERIGKTVGKSSIEVQKGLGNGEVSVTMFAQTLREVQLDKFGQSLGKTAEEMRALGFGALAAQRSTQTLSGQWDNFKAILTEKIGIPLAEEFTKFATDLAPKLTPIIARIGEVLSNNRGVIIGAIKGIGVAMAAAAAVGVGFLAFLGGIPLLITGAVAAFAAFAGAIYEDWAVVKRAWQDGVNAIKSFSLVDFGKQLVLGLANGITGAASEAVAALGSVLSGMYDSGKKFLGINSPSKLYAEQGRFIAEGLAIGIDDGSDSVYAASQDMADGAIAEAAQSAGSSGLMMEQSAAMAGSAGTVNNNGGNSSHSSITIGPFNVSGSANPEETAMAIRDALASELASIFDQHAEGVGA